MDQQCKHQETSQLTNKHKSCSLTTSSRHANSPHRRGFSFHSSSAGFSSADQAVQFQELQDRYVEVFEALRRERHRADLLQQQLDDLAALKPSSLQQQQQQQQDNAVPTCSSDKLHTCMPHACSTTSTASSSALSTGADVVVGPRSGRTLMSLCSTSLTGADGDMCSHPSGVSAVPIAGSDARAYSIASTWCTDGDMIQDEGSRPSGCSTITDSTATVAVRSDNEAGSSDAASVAAAAAAAASPATGTCSDAGGGAATAIPSGGAATASDAPAGEAELDAPKASDLVCISRKEYELLQLKVRAMDVLREGITIADCSRPEMPLVYVNAGFSRITGYNISDAVGHNCRFLQGPGTDQETLAELRSAIKSGKACVVQLINYKRNGDTFVNYLSVSPIYDVNGRLTHYVGIQSDITELVDHRRAELAAKHAALQAAAATEAKSSFLARMSHEIRTPLNGMIAVGQLLAETCLSPAQWDLVNTIRCSGETLLTLITDILDFSRIEANKMVINTAVFRLETVIEAAMEIAGLRAAQKRLQVAYHINERIPRLLLGDAQRLQQILLNVLNNAVKFTDHGEVLLEVWPEYVSAPASVPISEASSAQESSECNIVASAASGGNPAPLVPPATYTSGTAVAADGTGSAASSSLYGTAAAAAAALTLARPAGPPVEVSRPVSTASDGVFGLVLATANGAPKARRIARRGSSDSSSMMAAVAGTGGGALGSGAVCCTESLSSCCVHFSVRDTGIGITAADQGKLFNSFSQVDSAPTRRFGGSGLGLAISKRLCEAMGGTMWAESAGLGCGSTFRWTIMCRVPLVASHVHRASTHMATKPTRDSFGRYTEGPLFEPSSSSMWMRRMSTGKSLGSESSGSMLQDGASSSTTTATTTTATATVRESGDSARTSSDTMRSGGMAGSTTCAPASHSDDQAFSTQAAVLASTQHHNGNQQQQQQQQYSRHHRGPPPHQTCLSTISSEGNASASQSSVSGLSLEATSSAAGGGMAAAGPQPQYDATLPLLRGKRVLLLEPCTIVRQALTLALRAWGCHVCVAATEDEAISRIMCSRAAGDAPSTDPCSSPHEQAQQQQQQLQQQQQQQQQQQLGSVMQPLTVAGLSAAGRADHPREGGKGTPPRVSTMRLEHCRSLAEDRHAYSCAGPYDVVLLDMTSVRLLHALMHADDSEAARLVFVGWPGQNEIEVAPEELSGGGGGCAAAADVGGGSGSTAGRTLSGGAAGSPSDVSPKTSDDLLDFDLLAPVAAQPSRALTAKMSQPQTRQLGYVTVTRPLRQGRLKLALEEVLLMQLGGGFGGSSAQEGHQMRWLDDQARAHSDAMMEAESLHDASWSLPSQPSAGQPEAAVPSSDAAASPSWSSGMGPTPLPHAASGFPNASASGLPLAQPHNHQHQQRHSPRPPHPQQHLQHHPALPNPSGNHTQQQQQPQQQPHQQHQHHPAHHHNLPFLLPAMVHKSSSNEMLDKMAHAASQGSQSSQRGGSDASSGPHSGAAVRILIAEDNAINMKVALGILKRVGFTNFVTAQNGVEALEAMISRGGADAFDLVLMDLHMPEMTGMQAMHEVQQRWPKHRVRVVAVTADAFEDTRDECIKAGFDGWLPKPFRIEDLVRVIAEHIKLP